VLGFSLKSFVKILPRGGGGTVFASIYHQSFPVHSNYKLKYTPENYTINLFLFSPTDRKVIGLVKSNYILHDSAIKAVQQCIMKQKNCRLLQHVAGVKVVVPILLPK
jgi:hypothetical protein